jgi:hypothetical protein
MSNSPKDTAAYSSSKAPETRKPAEERETVKDTRLQPGGATPSPSMQGMAGLDDSGRRESE